MSHWTIVPARGLASGKTRLAELLEPAERRALNTTLLLRAFDAIAGCDGDLSRCIVASADADALQMGRRCGALTLQDSGASGLNAALEAARDVARRGGAQSILVLAADLPDVSGDALSRLRAATAAGDATLIADKQGNGTNGILLPAACAMKFGFGEGSLARHRDAIQADGVAVSVWTDPRLSFDIDSPADYRSWLHRPAPEPLSRRTDSST